MRQFGPNFKLSLNGAWFYCLNMWKWIAENYDERGGSEDYPEIEKWRSIVAELKEIWMKKNGFQSVDLSCNCFFCEYNYITKDDYGTGDCIQCPGKLIDKSFDCDNDDYCWVNHPKEFYRKLVELDKIRRKTQVNTGFTPRTSITKIPVARFNKKRR